MEHRTNPVDIRKELAGAEGEVKSTKSNPWSGKERS